MANTRAKKRKPKRPRIESRHDERPTSRQFRAASSDRNVSVVIPTVPLPDNVIVIDSSSDEEIIPVRRVLVEQPRLELVNVVDNARLPSNFEFIDDYVFRSGTQRLAADFLTGCTCRLDNGRNIGCEYVEKCECLDDAAVREDGKRIGFPYHGVGIKKGCLQSKYLETRHVIYECSNLCQCVSWCRNKVVQHGRTLPLEIFKTATRGWGLRSPMPIQRGQFIDTYRGEVITDAEATRREKESRKKDSYLFSLDKFSDLVDQDDELYVVDGEFYGGPTRFINHSCDPNCGIWAVSKTRGDARVYDLAFFALEDIAGGTELTFDYLDMDDEAEAEQNPNKVKEKEIKLGKLATKCLCGTRNCRGFVWGV